MPAPILHSPFIAQAAPGGGGGSFILIAQFLLIGLIFWFFIIRPQQRQMREHRAKLDAVKKGDSVVTGGGIYGKITKVEADAVEVEIASGVRVKVVKSTLTDVQGLNPGKAAND